MRERTHSEKPQMQNICTECEGGNKSNLIFLQLSKYTVLLHKVTTGGRCALMVIIINTLHDYKHSSGPKVEKHAAHTHSVQLMH